MNRLIKTAMFAAAGVALIAQSASAAQSYATGDLILGIRETGAANDLLVDLGPASTFLSASAPINLDTLSLYNTTYPTLEALITHVFGGPQGNGVNPLMWSVTGETVSGATLQNWYTTDPSASTTPVSAGSLAQVNSAFGTIVGSYRNGVALVTNHGSEKGSASPSYTTAIASIDSQMGFTAQQSIPSTGTSSSEFSTFTAGSSPTLDGTFSFDSTGAATFTPVAVPEPGTYGIIASAGLLILAIRRRLTANNV